MLPMHDRTPGLDRLGQDRPRVVDEVLPLVQRLIHTLVGFVGQLMNALFGSSRHLVVGADSATAAILAAGRATQTERPIERIVR